MEDPSGALSTAIQQSGRNPSVFEIIAEESLHASTQPAIRHVIKILASYSPEKFGWIHIWFDELYILFELALQNHFLNNHSATFTERYFDLKRVFDGSNLLVTSWKFTQSRHHLASLFISVMLPYFRMKLENCFQKVKEDIEVGHINVGLHKKLIYRLYPVMHATGILWSFYYYLMYALSKSKVPSPLFHFLGLKLMTVHSNAKDESSSPSFSQMMTMLLTNGVDISVFSLQFLDWWYDESNKNLLKEVLKRTVPPPPSSSINTKKNYGKDVCPICNRTRRNETVVMTSGYAFCYVCVYKYVKKHGKCPVTGYKTNVNNLTKVYRTT